MFWFLLVLALVFALGGARGLFKFVGFLGAAAFLCLAALFAFLWVS